MQLAYGIRRGTIFPTRVLLAADGSKETSLAVQAAVRLANGTSSELHVVYVVSVAPELPYPHFWEKEKSEALLEWKKLKGLKVLDNLVWRIEEELSGRVAASHYREGKPEKEVVRLGEEINAGLIITGGRRRKWFERVFGPDFAENVLRRAKCPVLVVGEQGTRGSTVARQL